MNTAAQAVPTMCRWMDPVWVTALVWVTFAPRSAADAPAFLPPLPDQVVVLPDVDAATGRDPGYRVRITSAEFASPGMMRVELQFDSRIGPTSSDRDFQIALTPRAGAHLPPDASVAAGLELMVPQGSTTHRVAFHVPKPSYGNGYLVTLQDPENPRAGPGVRFEGELGTMIRREERSLNAILARQERSSVLWINTSVDSHLRDPSMRHLIAPRLDLFGNNTSVPGIDWDLASRSGRVSSRFWEFESRDVGQLPEDWRSFQPWDIVVVHQSQWLKWQQTATPSSRAIRDWIAGGGTLVVRGHHDPATLPTSNRDPKAKWTDGRRMIDMFEEVKSSVQRWQATEERQRNNATLQAIRDSLPQAMIDSANALMRTAIQNAESEAPLELATSESSAEIVESLRRFPVARLSGDRGVQIESLMAGHILHLPIRDTDVPVHVVEWRFVDVFLSWRRSHLMRLGVEPMMGSQRFYQWAIPGVAQPPVYTFMGLLTLFVILVGPIAYRKTTRSGRGYLMFVIAPLLAVFTTVSMLAYGIVADGFGTQARIRQVTWLDSRSGDAFTRTRAAFFAGIRPSDGLAFPASADVTVFPDNQQRSWEDRVRDRAEIRGAVEVNDQELRFNSLFLPSRQQRQFVTHQPRRNWGHVELIDAASDAITIRQTSDDTMRDFIARNADGVYFRTDALPPNQDTPLQPVRAQEASKQLGELYKRQWLVSSVVNTNSNRNARGYNREIYDVMSSLQGLFPGTFKPIDGVFEAELQQRLQLGSGLPFGSFIATVGLTADAFAIEDAAAKESIHYVMGDIR